MIVRYISILFMLILVSVSCNRKTIFSVRLPEGQKGFLSGEKIAYNRAVQLRYSSDKTLFFSSMDNMLKHIKKDHWNLPKAGVKKAYVVDYFSSKDKNSERWINATVAFYFYTKDKDGKRILVAVDNPKVLAKHKEKVLDPSWKYTKSMQYKYFTFIELIRELRAEKKALKKAQKK